MARPSSLNKDSIAHLGFEAKLWLSADKLRNNMDAAEPSGARQPKRSEDSPACFSSKRPGQIAKGNPQGKRGGVHQFGVPPKTAMRSSAIIKPKSILRVVSEAKDNNANFAWVQHFIHHLALAA